MNAEFLVASLWGVVVVYWLWTRRPAGDSIGSFRNELHVLEYATPMRVPAAHKLSPASEVLADLGNVVSQAPLVLSPAQARAAAREQRQAEVRRRRREVLVALVVFVGVTLVGAVLAGSMALVGAQVLADLALGGYVALLVTKARPGLPAVRPAERLAERPVQGLSSTVAATIAAPVPLVTARPVVPAALVTGKEREPALGRAVADEDVPGVDVPGTDVADIGMADIDLDLEAELSGLRREGAHFRGDCSAGQGGRPRRRVVPNYVAAGYDEEAEPYGDFGSYASLALARAN